MSHITSYIVNSQDYFAAYTDNNEIRFGLSGELCFQISKNHPIAEKIINCKTSEDVENIFDGFYESR